MGHYGELCSVLIDQAWVDYVRSSTCTLDLVLSLQSHVLTSLFAGEESLQMHERQFRSLCR